MDQQEIIKFSLVFFKYLITAKCKKQSIKLISDLMGRRKVLRALNSPPPPQRPEMTISESSVRCPKTSFSIGECPREG